jgi:hypothetical protein
LATLLKPVWRIDALECPKCGGRMGPVAVILDPEVGEDQPPPGAGDPVPAGRRRVMPAH